MLISSDSKETAKGLVRELKKRSPVIRDEDIMALDETIINYIIEEGESKEQTVAFWLCGTPIGNEMLLRN